MYINTATNEVVSEQQIRLDNPNTSFGSPFQAPEDYAWVFPTPAPTYDPTTQGVRETAPQISAKGNYEQQWEVVDLSQAAIDAIAAAAKAQKDAGIKAQIAALDLRRIRPLAEGDTAYLADLNAQIVALRDQL